MILGSLKNTETIEKLHPLFKKAFDYLRTVDLDLIPVDGSKIELDRNRLFLSVSEYQGKPQKGQKRKPIGVTSISRFPSRGLKL